MKKPRIRSIVELRSKDYSNALLAREGVLLGTYPSVRIIGMALGWNGCRGKRRQMAILEAERRGMSKEWLPACDSYRVTTEGPR